MRPPELSAGAVELSVIITVVGGPAFLPRCLATLWAQVGDRSIEIIVAYDATAQEVSNVGPAFPRTVLLELGDVETAAAPGTFAAAHELYDRQRARGLEVARGNIVAIIEDYEIVASDWVDQVLAAHRMPHGVVGGAVEHVGTGTLNWAVYLLDFARYQLPLVEGPATYLTDVNISYKREAIQSVKHLWSERYHEVSVHWQLARNGETLWLRPQMVVSQDRGRLNLRRLLGERVAWGRLFAQLRNRESSLAARVGYAIASPLVPWVLVARVGYKVFCGRRHRLQAVQSFPAMVMLSHFWCIGELLGYVFGQGSKATQRPGKAPGSYPDLCTTTPMAKIT